MSLAPERARALQQPHESMHVGTLPQLSMHAWQALLVDPVLLVVAARSVQPPPVTAFSQTES